MSTGILSSHLQGSIEFVESDSFHIDVNVTSPTFDELRSVRTELSKGDGSLLLQVVSRGSITITASCFLIRVSIFRY